jgi:hypothetical protein
MFLLSTRLSWQRREHPTLRLMSALRTRPCTVQLLLPRRYADDNTTSAMMKRNNRVSVYDRRTHAKKTNKGVIILNNNNKTYHIIVDGNNIGLVRQAFRSRGQKIKTRHALRRPHVIVSLSSAFYFLSTHTHTYIRITLYNVFMPHNVVYMTLYRIHHTSRLTGTASAAYSRRYESSTLSDAFAYNTVRVTDGIFQVISRRVQMPPSLSKRRPARSR